MPYLLSLGSRLIFLVYFLPLVIFLGSTILVLLLTIGLVGLVVELVLLLGIGFIGLVVELIGDLLGSLSLLNVEDRDIEVKGRLETCRLLSSSKS